LCTFLGVVVQTAHKYGLKVRGIEGDCTSLRGMALTEGVIAVTPGQGKKVSSARLEEFTAYEINNNLLLLCPSALSSITLS